MTRRRDHPVALADGTAEQLRHLGSHRRKPIPRSLESLAHRASGQRFSASRASPSRHLSALIATGAPKRCYRFGQNRADDVDRRMLARGHQLVRCVRIFDVHLARRHRASPAISRVPGQGGECRPRLRGVRTPASRPATAGHRIRTGRPESHAPHTAGHLGSKHRPSIRLPRARVQQGRHFRVSASRRRLRRNARKLASMEPDRLLGVFEPPSADLTLSRLGRWSRDETGSPGNHVATLSEWSSIGIGRRALYVPFATSASSASMLGEPVFSRVSGSGPERHHSASPADLPERQSAGPKPCASPVSFRGVPLRAGSSASTRYRCVDPWALRGSEPSTECDRTSRAGPSMRVLDRRDVSPSPEPLACPAVRQVEAGRQAMRGCPRRRFSP